MSAEDVGTSLAEVLERGFTRSDLLLMGDLVDVTNEARRAAFRGEVALCAQLTGKLRTPVLLADFLVEASDAVREAAQVNVGEGIAFVSRVTSAPSVVTVTMSDMRVQVTIS